jgi:protein SCO1/2
LLVLGAAAGIWYLGRPAPLPDLGTAPTYQLTNQESQLVKSSDLLGQVQLVSFIWTNCTDICPLVTTEMKTLQVALQSKNLESHVHLVSISVDPERDTPEVMKAYAQGYGADLSRWQFLTGDVETVRGAVVTGFHIPMEKGPVGGAHSAHGGNSDYNVSHSGKIALVDKTGVIRGWYDGTSINRDQLLSDLQSLLRS